MNVHVFYRDLLLALAAVAIERVEQHGKGARDLASLVQIIPEEPGRLIGSQSVPEAVHSGIVAGEQQSDSAAFLVLAGIAASGFLLYFFGMPETRDLAEREPDQIATAVQTR